MPWDEVGWTGRGEGWPREARLSPESGKAKQRLGWLAMNRRKRFGILVEDRVGAIAVIADIGKPTP